MQVPPSQFGLGAPAPPGVATLRAAAGDLAGLPVGQLLAAVVKTAHGPQAVLQVGDQTVIVSPGVGLKPGAATVVRLPPGQPGKLEVFAPPPRPGPEPPVQTPAGPSPPPAGPAAPQQRAATAPGVPEIPPPAVPGTSPGPPAARAPTAPPLPDAGPALQSVEVLTRNPDGTARVRVDGGERAAMTPGGLVAGERYVLRVESTPAGLKLHPPAGAADAPELVQAIATAVIRSARAPDLPAAVAPLLQDLGRALGGPGTPPAVAGTPPPGLPAPAVPPPLLRAADGSPGRAPELPAPVRQAAEAVRETLQSFLPPRGQPPSAEQLRALVEDGGLHYEAKLARLAAGGDADRPGAAGGGPAGADLKGRLMQLLDAVRAFGSAADFPAARAALDGIEAQQAANVLSQQQGGPFFLQVPFPDGDHWKTLHLGVESDHPPGGDDDPPGRPGGFRVLMHVPLGGLGDTWVEAALAGDRFRAVLYLGGPTLDRVRAELPALRAELLGEGFGEVVLDARPAAALSAEQRRRAAAVVAGRPASVSVLDVRA